MEPQLGPDDAVDPDGPVPAYRQLAAILAAQIDRGDWPPGRAIPSESRLQQETGLSRVTVRHAVQVLAEAGYVTVVHGRGAFVVDRSRGA